MGTPTCSRFRQALAPLRARRRLAPVLLAVIALAAIPLQTTSVLARPRASARTACTPYGTLPHAPCTVGNIWAFCQYVVVHTPPPQCGYGYTATESIDEIKTPASHFHIKCKVSPELGTRTGSMSGPPIRNPHKTVRCHGTARFLTVFVTDGPHSPVKIIKHHGKHSVEATLRGTLEGKEVFEDGHVAAGQGLVVLAEQ